MCHPSKGREPCKTNWLSLGTPCNDFCCGNTSNPWPSAKLKLIMYFYWLKETTEMLCKYKLCAQLIFRNKHAACTPSLSLRHLLASHIHYVLSLVKCFLAFLDKAVFKLKQLGSWARNVVAIKPVKKKSGWCIWQRSEMCSQPKRSVPQTDHRIENSTKEVQENWKLEGKKQATFLLPTEIWGIMNPAAPLLWSSSHQC